ncbi:MAG: BatA domain-containing protein [Victivallaceae bacterium]
MNFTHQALLWGLIAVAIPVIIHLFNFKRFKKTYFTNVKLIKQLSEETRRQSKLRHLIILLLRILAIVALTVAFAGPYIPADKQQTHTGKKKLVSIYLDNSFSMEMRDAENILLESAKSRIPDILNAYTSEDAFRLITNDFKPQHQHLLTPDELLGYATEVTLSPVTRTLSTVLDRLQEVPDDAKGFFQEIYVLSDLQRAVTDFESMENDSMMHVRMIPLQAESHENLFIDSCWFTNPVHIRNSMLTLKARVVNTSGKRYEKVPVKVIVDEKQRAMASIDLPPNASAIAEFHFMATHPGNRKAIVSLNDYPVSYDDTYFFTYRIIDRIPVLIVNGNGTNHYLTTLFTSDSTFLLQTTEITRLTPSLIAANDFILLNEVANPGSGIADELIKQSLTGKSILIIPSVEEPGNATAIFSALQLPVPRRSDTTHIRVSHVAVYSDFFKQVFNPDELKAEGLPEKTDLPMVFRRYPIPNVAGSNMEALLSLAGNEPFLIRKPSGSGWIYAFASPLRENAGNLVQHALFVPIMYRMAFLSSVGDHPGLVIGQDTRTRIKRDETFTERVEMEHTNSGYRFIPGIERHPGYLDLLLYDHLSDAGFYTLYQDEIPVHTVAANYNRMESDLVCYTKNEAIEAIASLKINTFSIIDSLPGRLASTLETLNKGRQLWHYFVYLCLIFLLGEVILLRLWK